MDVSPSTAASPWRKESEPRKIPAGYFAPRSDSGEVDSALTPSALKQADRSAVPIATDKKTALALFFIILPETLRQEPKLNCYLIYY